MARPQAPIFTGLQLYLANQLSQVASASSTLHRIAIRSGHDPNNPLYSQGGVTAQILSVGFAI
jgi:hypothetical protein